MAIDLDALRSTALPEFDVRLERGRLRAFAQAIGERAAVYTDVDAARAAGHPDLLMPPTFLFSLYLEADDPWGYLTAAGADLRGMLHGEQSFTYHRDIHAGETITLRPRIADAYAKNSRMDFLVHHVDHVRGDELVAESESVIIMREVAAA